MSIGLTKSVGRSLLACLSPLAGTRSTGNITVRSTVGAGDITLPKGSYIVPDVASSHSALTQEDRTMPFFVSADTLVTEAGAVVPITSVVGGARHNLPAGNWRFDPPLAGVELVPTSASQCVGAADSSDLPGQVRRVLATSDLSGPDYARKLFQGLSGQLPAITITFQGDTGKGETRSANVEQVDFSWSIHIAVDNRQSSLARHWGATDIVDAVRSLLNQRVHVDGVAFSHPPIRWAGAKRAHLSTASEIWEVKIETHQQVTPCDAPERVQTYAAWLRTAIQTTTATVSPLPVVDADHYFHTEDDDDGPLDPVGGGLGMFSEDEYTPTVGQITFVLSSAPTDPNSLVMEINGVNADDGSDFVLSGTTITWLNSAYSLDASDKVVIRYV